MFNSVLSTPLQSEMKKAGSRSFHFDGAADKSVMLFLRCTQKTNRLLIDIFRVHVLHYECLLNLFHRKKMYYAQMFAEKG